MPFTSNGRGTHGLVPATVYARIIIVITTKTTVTTTTDLKRYCNTAFV
jgi:hypothetical protein